MHELKTQRTTLCDKLPRSKRHKDMPLCYLGSMGRARRKNWCLSRCSMLQLVAVPRRSNYRALQEWRVSIADTPSHESTACHCKKTIKTLETAATPTHKKEDQKQDAAARLEFSMYSSALVVTVVD